MHETKDKIGAAILAEIVCVTSLRREVLLYSSDSQCWDRISVFCIEEEEEKKETWSQQTTLSVSGLLFTRRSENLHIWSL